MQLEAPAVASRKCGHKLRAAQQGLRCNASAAAGRAQAQKVQEAGTEGKAKQSRTAGTEEMAHDEALAVLPSL